ncbi:MAG: RNase adapter RapZ [Desulfuromonadaceae bacterium]|nr:RNase adapter RapZ [Desulfuromonadaceae bacterium]
MRFIIITGLSGSGKSTAARVLEDEGFYVVDNFPLALLPQFLELDVSGTCPASPGVALVMDVRTPHFMAGGDTDLQAVQNAGYELEIYFFDAADDALVRRFSTTRRRHPLKSYQDLGAAIAGERLLLSSLRQQASVVFDTTSLSVHELKASVLRQLHGSADQAVPLTVRLQSFGFRHGLPVDADLVVDVRFLPNPHYVEALRPLTGQDSSVRDFVLNQPVCQQFMEKTVDWLGFLLPHYRREGKSYLTVAVGCTGGHHRSVAIVEALHRLLMSEGLTIRTVHRDLIKEDG